MAPLSQVELFQQNIQQMDVTFYNDHVSFEDDRGTKDLWTLTYEQFYNLEKIFSVFKEEQKRLAQRIEIFNKDSFKRKDKDIEKLKTEVNAFPWRKSQILDSNGLCAFIFVDFQSEGLAITRVFYKISILPYKTCVVNKKTGEKAPFPMSQKSVANGVSRILMGNFINALETHFSLLKQKLLPYGILPSSQSFPLDASKSTIKNRETLEIETWNKQGNLSCSEIVLSLHDRVKSFLNNENERTFPIIIKKPPSEQVLKRKASKSFCLTETKEKKNPMTRMMTMMMTTMTTTTTTSRSHLQRAAMIH